MTTARHVARDVLLLVERDGARANPALAAALADGALDERDRALATQLVYGTLRHRRPLDERIDRFARGALDDEVRTVLRLGAHQLVDLRIPAHAAVNETVALAPRRARGLVNAVLRRVATDPRPAAAPTYPDWMIDRLRADLGRADADAALAAMDTPVSVDPRPDGYVQDPASRWVADLVGAGPGTLVVDLCAGPGGKATALAGAGAAVVAVEVVAARARDVVAAAGRTGCDVAVAVADGRAAPLADGCADAVLVDAPCSGLGALRRRPDARFRATPADVDRLVPVQRGLVAGAARLVRPGGTVVFAACTLTRAETVEVDGWVAAALPWLRPEPPPEPWRRWGRGGLVLPQDHGTDGMAAFRYVAGPRAGHPGPAAGTVTRP